MKYFLTIPEGFIMRVMILLILNGRLGIYMMYLSLIFLVYYVTNYALSAYSLMPVMNNSEIPEDERKSVWIDDQSIFVRERHPTTRLFATQPGLFFTVLSMDDSCFLAGLNRSSTLMLHDSCYLTITWTDEHTFFIAVNGYPEKSIVTPHVSNISVELTSIGNIYAENKLMQNMSAACTFDFEAIEKHYDTHLSMICNDFGGNCGSNSSCSVTIAFNNTVYKLMKDESPTRNDWWHILVIMFGCAIGVCLAIAIGAICVYRRLTHSASGDAHKTSTMKTSTLKTSSVAELSSMANNKDNKSPEKPNRRKESLNGFRNRPPMISMHAIQANFGAGAGSTTPQDSNSQLSHQHFESDYSRK